MKTAITCLKPSSGGLHLGHYIGNIMPLIHHQYDDELECIFMFADLQVYNLESKEDIHNNIYLMMRQLLSLGVNPNKVKFLLESDIKKNHMEDLVFLSNYVTTSRIMRLPVFKFSKMPIKMSKFMFPIFQVLDFYITKASIAFSNSDNNALIEFTNEVFRKINNEYKLDLSRVELVHGKVDNLVGFDGYKMSKDNNNCIFFNDDETSIERKVNKMYTDPKRIKYNIPGDIGNNIVFKYLKAFLDDHEYLYFKEEYEKGNIGDVYLKKILTDILCNLIIPVKNGFSIYSDKEISKLLGGY